MQFTKVSRLQTSTWRPGNEATQGWLHIDGIVYWLWDHVCHQCPMDKTTHLTASLVWASSPQLPVTPAQLMRYWLKCVLCSGWLCNIWACIFFMVHWLYTLFFNGFSVGCCINREKGYLLPTWVRKVTLPTFQLNVPVVISCHFSELKLVTDNLSLYMSFY